MMHNKIEYTGELSLCPCPTVLVTSKVAEKENVLAVSWTGIASSHPEYVTIAINKKRYSHALISQAKKFCINIPNANMIHEVDFCGSYSGREIDKFATCGFSKLYYKNEYVLINECVMHILCQVEAIYPLGSHDLFIGKVNCKLMDSSVSNIHRDINPIVYFRPNYYQLNKNNLGHYGFTKENNRPQACNKAHQIDRADYHGPRFRPVEDEPE